MSRPTLSEIKQSAEDYVNDPQVNKDWDAQERANDVEFSNEADAARHESNSEK